MDEFALWIHLRDVYWSEEGRASFDAVVVATVIGGLIVLGAVPFDLPNNSSSVDTLLSAVVVDVLLAAVTIIKGKRLLGLIGIYLPLVSLIGAVNSRRRPRRGPGGFTRRTGAGWVALGRGGGGSRRVGDGWRMPSPPPSSLRLNRLRPRARRPTESPRYE